MMKRNLSFVLPCFLLCIACAPSPEVPVSRSGVSFICPAGWKITEEESYDDEGHYLSLEKAGFNSSGLFTITWVNDSIELSSWLEVFQEELRNNFIFKNSNLEFGEAGEGTFAGNPTLASKFTVSLLGLDHEGMLHVFYGKDKTIALIRQEALEDHAANREGFTLIEQSFRLE